jgi:hypothetical protein
MEELNKCPKCRAGRAALYVDRHPAHGGMAHCIACARCGWRLYEEAQIDKPLQREMLEQGPGHHRKGGFRDQGDAPCAVVGCKHKICSTRSTTGFCYRCNMTRKAWLNGKRTQPPPFTCVDGRWHRTKDLPAAVKSEKSLESIEEDIAHA